MYLKNITLRGFKSFASKTTLNLENGITCIVGPNGSGKSNVVDALAWVMGEQGAKTLRGSKMDDVIFAGSDGKSSALGRAEVSLTIDNTDGALPIEYTEVTISRTMFRGGGSEYRINDSPCRLLDIQELLSDTGLGKEMHVIVGQGKLDNILNASSLDRRAFIEEAAGVLKHRQRKEKALRKLDGVQINLNRINDLVLEVRRNLGPLGRQADVAKRANVIQINLRDALARILADDYTNLKNHKDEELTRIKDASENKIKLQNVIGIVEDEISALESKLTDKEVQSITDQLHALQTLNEKYHSLSSLASQKQEHLSEVNLLFEGQNPEVIKKSYDEALKEYELAGKELQGSEKELSAVRSKLEDAKHQLQLTKNRYDLLQKTSNDKNTEIARIEANITHIDQQITEQKEFLDANTKALAANNADSKQFNTNFDKLEKDFEKSEQSLTDFTNKMQSDLENLDKIKAQYNDKTTEYNEIVNSISAIDGSIDALETMLKNQLGDNIALRSKKLKAQSSVAALRKLEAQFRDISTEIGDDYVIASNSNIANQVAETIATLSVLNLDGELLYHEALDGKNSEISDDTVSIREQIAIFDGEKSTLTRKLKVAEKALKVAEDTLNKAQDLLNKQQTQQSKLNLELNDAKAKISELNSKRQILSNERERIENASKRAKDRILELQNDQKLLKKKVIELSKGEQSSESLNELSEQIASLEHTVSSSQESYNKWSTDYASQKTHYEALGHKASDLDKQYQFESAARAEAAEAEKKRQVLSQKITIIVNLSQQIQAILTELITKTLSVRSELIAKQTASSNELIALRKDREAKKKELDDINELIHRYELDATNIDGKIDAVKSRIEHEIAMNLTDLLAEYAPHLPIKLFDGYFTGDKKKDAVVAKILDDKSNSEDDKVVAFKREEQMARFNRASRDLTTLGKVNPLALEEFNAAEERYRYLSDQLADLEKSKQDSLEMIAHIDERTISTFKSAYEDTAREFEKVFSILFPGGKGCLKLTDPNDYLTTGIEIEATPAGKRISKLSLLSGGERSLVAVALMVSIFIARPSPFYVMDEVEAALDDVNLSRLLKIFKQLKENSQLLIVTHQKRTMEVADALYGITMRKDGITQVISQKIA